jgi:hypothetical protein
MPFRSLDDLRYLIDDELPRRARDALAKTSTWLEGHFRRPESDRRDVLALADAARIVRAMKDVPCGSDPDSDGQANRFAGLPRFRLRH